MKKVLQLWDVPKTNRTKRIILKPAWHYIYDSSSDEIYNFAMAAIINGNVPFNYEEAILSADAENGKLQYEPNSIVLWPYLLENH